MSQSKLKSCPIYHGAKPSDGSVEVWLQKFQLAYITSGMTDEMALLHVLLIFEGNGPAFTWFNSLPSALWTAEEHQARKHPDVPLPFKTVQAFKVAMLARFLDPLKKQKDKQVYYHMTQGQVEGMTDFINRYSVAIEPLHTEIKEEDLVIRFIAALQAPFKHSLSLTEAPSTLQVAYTRARQAEEQFLELEKYKALALKQSTKISKEIQIAQATAALAAVSIKPGATRRAPVYAGGSQASAKSCAYHPQSRTHTTAECETGPAQAAAAAAAGVAPSPAVKQETPSVHAVSSDSASRRSREVTCYYCKQSGHIKMQCPKWLAKQAELVAVHIAQSQSSEVNMLSYAGSLGKKQSLNRQVVVVPERLLRQ